MRVSKYLRFPTGRAEARGFAKASKRSCLQEVSANLGCRPDPCGTR